MSEKTVLLNIDEEIATITLNRPAAMNSINQEFVDDFIEVLRSIQQDNKIRAVVLTGNGKAFCAGGDLFYLVSIKDPIAARNFITQAGQIVMQLVNIDKPIIAMVNGVAAGAGFNLALACDIIFCAKSAKFAQSFVKVGLVPDCGGMYLLPRIVGLHKAKELMYTADLIDAYTAFEIGVVNRVIEDEILKETTYQFAKRLADAAPIAIGLMKKIINRSDNLDLNDVLEFETDLQTICMQTQDHQEGVAAFKEKRAAVFKGN